MSLRLRSLTRAVLRHRPPIRSSPASLHCPPRHAYATQAQPLPPTKPSIFGQPTAKSHTHLVNPGEVTPGIPASEYERRRRQLIDGLPDGSLVVCMAGHVKYMSGAIFYKFRQASDFWYLTGFEEPDSALILEKNSSPRGFRMLLYSTGKDPSKEKWDGASTRFTDVVALFGADDARPLDTFTDDLRALVARAEHVYADISHQHQHNHNHNQHQRHHQHHHRRISGTRLLLKYLSRGQQATTSHSHDDASGQQSYLDVIAGSRSKRRSLAPLVGTLRSVKSECEVEVMKASAEISARAHAKTMRFAQPGLSEADLRAHFEYICARGGAQRSAYVPVVASGENALIIHYTRNDHLLRDGELVLMDAGGEYNGYASDISRTFPVNGTFTPPQRDLYAALLAAQKALVAECAVARGHTLDTLHRRSVDLLRAELSRVGVPCAGPVLERVLYPHYLTHPIGIDLHESGTVERNAPLKEGMVITIEPGVYVPADPQFPKHFHGFGMRIEDEVLIGAEHPVVLSASAPKEIEDVEGACQGALEFGPF
ncbi:peptidase M24 [Russula ochroleuca]|uniref:Peptidase M24 n=1 Tax=Russula ochroleuca TaxID=152965 RepID=A0A9P5N3E6_9AGAM|nr:peptidase M24 [Russula ochroleuca]